MREIRLYVEGGGNRASARRDLRRGFQEFLKGVRTLARRRNWALQVIPSGSRGKAYEDFRHARTAFPEATVLLLVDAEAPVRSDPWTHLRQRDSWSKHGEDHHCHLMAQVMESWFLADPEALAAHYGQGFAKSALPAVDDVEAVSKTDVKKALDAATRRTTKGCYHKINHGAALLGRVDSAKVRGRARHCERLFQTIEEIIAG